MKKEAQAVILIVDDREANLISLDALLGNDERHLITVRSGKEALEVVSRQRVDLILLDVQMPGMNGFEVAQVLKSNKASADIPIIFASAERIDHASRMKGFEEGAIDYLLKPLDPELTRAKVSVLLKVQHQKKQLIEKNNLLERSALLINNSADIIGIVDGVTLTIEEMNPAFAKLLGDEAHDSRGQSLASYMNSADARLLESFLDTRKEHLSFETEILCANRAVKCLDWNVVVKNKKWFANARDITEIRHLNSVLRKNLIQLQAAHAELESFSYSVSHDLRAPLRALHGNARILEEDFGEQFDEEAKKHLIKIKANASRMDHLINDLLAFSKVGKKEVRMTPVCMEALVREVFSEVSSGQTHNLTVEIGKLSDAMGDYAMLKQVWTNLVSNAIKYSSKKEAPRIEVGCASREGEVEYFVRDNGAGFDMAYADKLFGTFQRLHDANEFEGTGIGLAIVQRIILKHGGTIRAEAAPGKGACFYFALPPF